MESKHTDNHPNLAEQTTALVRSIFQTVWAEFYIWERHYCQQRIGSLARTGSRRVHEFNEYSRPDINTLQIFQELSLEGRNDYFGIWDYSHGSSSPMFQGQSVDLIDVIPPIEPFPYYESCTPCSRSIFTGDDSDDMAFIPFADDPNFNHVEYCKDYLFFAWQRNRDPDLEVIILETTRRLHLDHKVPFSHVDETGVLPLELLSRPHNVGLLHLSHQRDLPLWPGSPPTSSFPLHYSPTPLVSANSNLASLIAMFCNNLNCIQGYCPVHLEAIPMPNNAISQVTSDGLLNAATTPCGRGCFLFENPISLESFWSDDDIQTLRMVLDLTPDLSPCDLATICRKPCQEVFERRQYIIPDANIAKRDKPLKTRPVRNSSSEFSDSNFLHFTPNESCHHDGPCDARANCSCFLNKSHCEQGCRCSRKCNRRWRGCNCAKARNRNICKSDRCPCFLAHRECDPETCGRCEAKYFNSDVCQNCYLQQGRRKGTEVKQSRWGLGLFLTESAEEGDLIIEYVGELIYEPTTQSRDGLAIRRGRNYLFGLNPTLSIDSTYAGNESRFINHDSKMANCVANVRLVNGEHRIGIYAGKDLKVGSEVLFDYGVQFFQDAQSISSVESAVDGSNIEVPGQSYLDKVM